MATLTGTSADVIGQKSVVGKAKMDSERYPLCQVLTKLETQLSVVEDEDGNVVQECCQLRVCFRF